MPEPAVRIARVSLRVSDVGASADLYRRAAGLEPRELDGDAGTQGAPDGGPVLVALRRAERPGPSGSPAARTASRSSGSVSRT